MKLCVSTILLQCIKPISSSCTKFRGNHNTPTRDIDGNDIISGPLKLNLERDVQDDEDDKLIYYFHAPKLILLHTTTISNRDIQ